MVLVNPIFLDTIEEYEPGTLVSRLMSLPKETEMAGGGEYEPGNCFFHVMVKILNLSIFLVI